MKSPIEECESVSKMGILIILASTITALLILHRKCESSADFLQEKDEKKQECARKCLNVKQASSWCLVLLEMWTENAG